MGILSFPEGDSSFLHGVLACAVVAHCLVGVFIIFCGCSSCIVLGLLSSICSAFVGNLSVFEGAFELASISSYLISGGLWFSGLAGHTQKKQKTMILKNIPEVVEYGFCYPVNRSFTMCHPLSL